jgi:hypothetical protein
MRCTEARTDLPAFACGHLPPEASRRLEEHLAACPTCRRDADELRRVSRLLRADPAPAVEVDLAGLYREAAQRDALRLRRWRRLALAACAALAAGLLVAVCLNLEVRLEKHQVVLRWGEPPAADEPTPPAPQTIIVQNGLGPEDQRRLRALQELVETLAVDAETRDLERQQELDRLRASLAELRRQAVLHWEEAEQDVSALLAHQSRKKKGESP